MRCDGLSSCLWISSFSAHNNNYQEMASSLELVDGFHVHGLRERAFLQVLPPAHEEVVHHQPEPGGQLHAALAGVRLLDELPQLLPAHVLHVGHFVRVRDQLHVTHDEQQVVQLMFAPFPIRWCLVKHPTERGELVNGHIFSRDAQLIEELPLSSISDTKKVFLNKLRFTVQRMAAAGVGPY
uniref:Isopentenyl-diphosphate delta-isomerase II, chloroplastic n=1 Tax=Pistacia terebinthus subsp. palaestina TaxID=434239 RepID=A0A8F3C5A5_9ROSI|nr:isopentenyl-diphosphate delta-isomerase II, chloroplastic [Pistacia terebinthus subsp. palaestina]